MVTHDPRAASRGTRSLHLEKGRLLPEAKGGHAQVLAKI